MKFRSDTEIRVMSDDGVHSARIGDEWRELPPVLHSAAIAAGAEFDKGAGKVNKTEQTAGNPDALNQGGEDSVIRNALTALIERNSDEDFTSDNKPRVDAVNKLTGVNHTKTDILRVWDAMAAEASQK